jgi:hypothetical protein
MYVRRRGRTLAGSSRFQNVTEQLIVSIRSRRHQILPHGSNKIFPQLIPAIQEECFEPSRLIRGLL